MMAEKNPEKRKNIFPPLERLYRSGYVSKLQTLQQV
jgi:hypothetical protein